MTALVYLAKGNNSMTLITLSRPEAVRAIVTRKAQTLGAHPYIPLAVDHALHALEQGHSGARAIRLGTALAAELADNPDPR